MLLEFQRRLSVYFKKRLWNLIYARSFYFYGKNNFIESPYLVKSAKNISIGNNFFSAKNIWIGYYGEKSTGINIDIADNVYIGRAAHISAIDKIFIGNGVMIADNVFITDHNHSIEPIDIPVKNRPLSQIGVCHIGDNVWIGEKVSILGCKIGRGSVIGAGSVVTRDIPEYSIAVGIPAKVIRSLRKKV